MNKTSFWCDLLTDAERLVLEYGQDVEVRMFQPLYNTNLTYVSTQVKKTHSLSMNILPFSNLLTNNKAIAAAFKA